MADDKPADGPPELGSPEGLRSAWEQFRSGGPIACPVDRAPLALAVDASAAAYRFVCTRCGMSSAWFEAGPDGLRVMGHAPFLRSARPKHE